MLYTLCRFYVIFCIRFRRTFLFITRFLCGMVFAVFCDFVAYYFVNYVNMGNAHSHLLFQTLIIMLKCTLKACILVLVGFKTLIVINNWSMHATFYTRKIQEFILCLKYKTHACLENRCFICTTVSCCIANTHLFQVRF